MTATNTLLTNDVITNEALLVLRNNFVLVPRVAQTIDSLFGQVGYKNGSTVRIRIPVRYAIAQGAGINLNNTVESQTSLTLLQSNIGVDFTTEDLKLSIDLFADRILKPQIAQIASYIDQTGFELFYKAQSLATPGAIVNGIPAAFTGADVAGMRPFNDIRARMREQSCPTSEVYVALTPSAMAGVVDSLKGLFQSATEIAEQYKTGLMAIGAGFEWLEAQTLPAFTTGSRPTTGATVNGNGSPVIGSSITVATAGATDSFTKGDKFCIDGVYAINPLTRVSTGKLQVFSVQATATAVGSAVTLSVLPAINIISPDETVSAAAADGAAITFIGAANVTTDVNIAWHRDAFMVAFADLPTDLPGAVSSMARDPETGVAIRMTKQYASDVDVVYYRADVLFGFQMVRPQLAGLILG